MPKNHSDNPTQRETKSSYPYDFESKMEPSIVDLSTVSNNIFKSILGADRLQFSLLRRYWLLRFRSCGCWFYTMSSFG